MQYSNPMLAVKVLTKLQDDLNRLTKTRTRSVIRQNKKKNKQLHSCNTNSTITLQGYNVY